MTSERFTYTPVDVSTTADLHRLVADSHVRRYLLDGQVLPREWTEARIADSRELFRRRGVGLWLAHRKADGALVGFTGFLEDATPQLVYALFERYTGRGYATEMARAAIEAARQQPGFPTITASVDAVNTASVRVLEKLGFGQTDVRQGGFGDLLVLSLAVEAERSPRPPDRRRNCFADP